MLIAGDFNALLGPLGGPRVLGSPNLPGFALKEFIDRNLHSSLLQAVQILPQGHITPTPKALLKQQWIMCLLPLLAPS